MFQKPNVSRYYLMLDNLDCCDNILLMKKILATIYVFLYAVQVTADTPVLSSRNAYTLCTTKASHWIDFCNGLIQGYADYASLAEVACIPVGTTRTTLITVYINFLPQSEAYEKAGPALEAALEILSKAYPCSR